MNMDKLCVFAILWQIWHGNTIETHASFEITCFQCFFFVLVFASKCAINACFAINLVQKDDLVFLGAKEASGRKLPAWVREENRPKTLLFLGNAMTIKY